MFSDFNNNKQNSALFEHWFWLEHYWYSTRPVAHVFTMFVVSFHSTIITVYWSQNVGYICLCQNASVVSGRSLGKKPR